MIVFPIWGFELVSMVHFIRIYNVIQAKLRVINNIYIQYLILVLTLHN